jgi:hypothetical protein
MLESTGIQLSLCVELRQPQLARCRSCVWPRNKQEEARLCRCRLSFGGSNQSRCHMAE